MINYYLLMKPGIIIGNLITFAAGFLLASRGAFHGPLFFWALFGLALVIASACVCNNYIDRAVDSKMERTKKRPLASGRVQKKKALLFALLLGIGGNLILLTQTNLLTAGIANLGFLIYVCIYSLLKTHTPYTTLIGSLSGAIPPIVGYSAVSQQLDQGAIILFLVLFVWQMPHFFAIGLWRLNEYTKAGIPILPVSYGTLKTKVQILLYVACLIPTLALLPLYGYTGSLFFVVTTAIGLWWLASALKGFFVENDALWGRQMFRLSLLMINAISFLMIYDLK